MTVSPIGSLETVRFCPAPGFVRLSQAVALTGADAAVIGLPSDSAAPLRAGGCFAANAVSAVPIMPRPINSCPGNTNAFDGQTSIELSSSTKKGTEA
jgi:agmatinase